MVYFLGGASRGSDHSRTSLASCFTNAFLDIKQQRDLHDRRDAGAFAALILLDATGVIPHYGYIDQGAAALCRPAVRRYGASSPSIGVLFSIYLPG